MKLSCASFLLCAVVAFGGCRGCSQTPRIEAPTIPGTYQTGCWTPETYLECTTRGCPSGAADCCGPQTLGCMASSCPSDSPSNPCVYTLAGGNCHCVPGSCNGNQICRCTTKNVNDASMVIASQWADCPTQFPEYPICDPQRQRCVCRTGAQHCAGPSSYWLCNGDGSWVLTDCPVTRHTCDKTTDSCICVPNCGTRVCGDNGCGGTCGTCPANHPRCNDAGQCEGCPPCRDGQVCTDGGQCCDSRKGQNCVAGNTCGVRICDGTCGPRPGTCAHPELCGKVCSQPNGKCSFLNCDGQCDPQMACGGNYECITGGICNDPSDE